jgi:hypothetical protein
VSVPKEAASTRAKVTVSFAAWKEAHIAPATFEVPIEDVSPETEAREEREAKERAEKSRRILESQIELYKKFLEREKDPKNQTSLKEEIQQMKKTHQDMEKP